MRSKCTINRKTSLLHNSLGKNYSGSRNIIYCKGVQNPVCKSPIPGENTKLAKNVKRTIFTSGKEVLEMLEKGAIKKVIPTQGQFLSNLFLAGKKDWGNQPVVNLKNLNKFIPSLQAFQNGRSALPEIPSRTGRFAMQDRSQGGVFFSWPQQKLSKVCQISMVRRPIRICLLTDCHISQAWSSEVKKRRGGWRQYLLCPKMFMEINQ